MNKLVVLILIFLNTTSFPAKAEVILGTVSHVIDGDTITTSEGKIRITKVDSPELKQAHGLESKNFTESWLADWGPCLVLDIKGKDKYGRSLGTVLDPNNQGQTLSHHLVGFGQAWNYHGGKDFKILEQSARDGKLGLWQDSNPIPPWEWRKGKR